MHTKLPPPRLGIYKSWYSFKSWKKYQLALANGENMKDNVAKLGRYAETGEAYVNPKYSTGQLEKPWTSAHIYCPLAVTALRELGKWGMDSAERGGNSIHLSLTTCWMRLGVLAESTSTEDSIAKFGWRQHGRMSLKCCPWVALMIVCNHDGERMGRLLLEGYQRRRYFDAEYYPLFHMILRVIADWLDVRDTPWQPIAFSEPIMNAVAENWREPDTEKLVPILLNACDYHTHRCRAKLWSEFDNREFEHLPVEILMIFRLRESLGLTNPVLDHPLMNTPLGKLPALPLPECDDPLYRAVLARMQSQGFDPDKIYEAASNAPMPPPN